MVRMFYSSKLSFIPQLNLKNASNVDFNEAFRNTSKLVSPPIITGTNITSTDISKLFYDSSIESISDGYFNFFSKLLSGGMCHQIFYGC